MSRLRAASGVQRTRITVETGVRSGRLPLRDQRIRHDPPRRPLSHCFTEVRVIIDNAINCFPDHLLRTRAGVVRYGRQLSFLFRREAYFHAGSVGRRAAAISSQSQPVLQARPYLVQQQIHHHARNADVQPDRQGPLRQRAVSREVAGPGQAQRENCKHGDGGGQDGVGR